MLQGHDTNVQNDQISQAILYLAGRCDGASSIDGAGFNKFDSPKGHNLADRIYAGFQLDEATRFEAWKMLKKYRRQLSKAGYELPKEYEEKLVAVQVDAKNWAVSNLSKGSRYTVSSDEFGIYGCNCMAAQHGNYCDHLKLVDSLAVATDEPKSDEWWEPETEEISSEMADCEPEWMLERTATSAQGHEPNPFRDHLTQNQKEAFDLAHDWFLGGDSKQDPFVLKGFAGTGKSFTLQWIIKSLRDARPNLRVALCAPTHKAVHVLEEFAHKAGLENIRITTLHSLLHVRPGAFDHMGRQKLIPTYSKQPHFDDYDLVAIDESSMIGDELYHYVDRCSTPALFMGDPAQLPPVEDGEEEQQIKLSPIFDLPVGVELTEVKRYEGAIAQYATKLRQSIEAQFPPKFVTDGNLEKLAKDEWEQELVKAFKRADSSDPYAVRGLAWTNARVAQINELVRSAIFTDAKEPYLIGERLTAKDAIMQIDGWGNNQVVMYACAECTIDRVYRATERINGEDLPVYQLEVTTDLGDELTLTSVHPKGTPESHNYLNLVLKQIKKDIQELPKEDRAEKWKEYYRILEQFNLTVKGNRLLSRLQYAYGLTVHQSQGGTFGKVYGDVSNVFGCRVPAMRNRLLYVMATRASEQFTALSRI